LLLPRETRAGPLLLAAVPVHVAISLGWGVVLAALLPRRFTVLWGAVAGGGIAALDLNLPGERTLAVRELQTGPQVVDHLAYGVVVGVVVARLRLKGSQVVLRRLR